MSANSQAEWANSDSLILYANTTTSAVNVVSNNTLVFTQNFSSGAFSNAFYSISTPSITATSPTSIPYANVTTSVVNNFSHSSIYTTLEFTKSTSNTIYSISTPSFTSSNAYSVTSAIYTWANTVPFVKVNMPITTYDRGYAVTVKQVWIG